MKEFNFGFSDMEREELEREMKSIHVACEGGSEGAAG